MVLSLNFKTMHKISEIGFGSPKAHFFVLRLRFNKLNINILIL